MISFIQVNSTILRAKCELYINKMKQLRKDDPNLLNNKERIAMSLIRQTELAPIVYVSDEAMFLFD